eukprot:2821226-Rhodomonas_salina.2
MDPDGSRVDSEVSSRGKLRLCWARARLTPRYSVRAQARIAFGTVMQCITVVSGSTMPMNWRVFPHYYSAVMSAWLVHGGPQILYHPAELLGPGLFGATSGEVAWRQCSRLL